MVLASGREAEGRRELCQVGTAGAVKALRVVERGRRRVQNPHPPKREVLPAAAWVQKGSGRGAIPRETLVINTKYSKQRWLQATS